VVGDPELGAFCGVAAAAHTFPPGKQATFNHQITPAAPTFPHLASRQCLKLHPSPLLPPRGSCVGRAGHCSMYSFTLSASRG
jgi:hypothetical protein